MKSKILSTICCLIFLLSCLSANTIPEWVQNYKKVFPESDYLCQRGSGKTAKDAQTDAVGALSRYFQMNVNANLSTTMTAISTTKGISEEIEVIDDVKIMSQVDFFGLEFTEPYYYKKEKKWYCVAYINREDAWTQYKPQIEIEKNIFESFIKNAEKETDYFSKMKLLKLAWNKGKDLIEKLEYARIISPANEKSYSFYRDVFSEIPVLMEDIKMNSKIYINIQGDFANIFTSSISQSLTDCGFSIVKNQSESNFVAQVEIKDNAIGFEPLSITPSINIKILSQNNKTVFSYEKSTIEKTISYTLENAQKKAYPKLAEEIKVVLKEEFESTFNL